MVCLMVALAALVLSGGCGKLWSSVTYSNVSAFYADFQIGVGGAATEIIAMTRDSNQTTYLTGWTSTTLGNNLVGSNGVQDGFISTFDVNANLQ